MSGLLDHARRHPERPAYVLGNGTFVETYGELEWRSRRIALALRRLGLREGDVVASLLGNIPECFDVFWATQRLGLVLVPINWHLSGPEIAYIGQNCEARVLIAGAGLGDVAATAAGPLRGHIERFLSVGGPIDGFESLETLTTNAPATELTGQRAGTVMLYSSGTTGRPKGVRKPMPGCAFDDPSWTDAQPRFLKLFGLRDTDRYLCPAPLYHAAPLRSCAAVHVMGGTAFAMPRFDAEEALKILQDQKIEASQWVPTHFRRLLELPEAVRSRYERPHLRIAIHAAAPCPPSDKRRMIEWWGPILLEYYAGTEGGGTLIGSQDWLAHPGSVGRPWANVDLAILDGSGEAIESPGTDGAIHFRDRAAPAFAYFKDEDKTRSAFRGDWFALGDIGHVDRDGFLYLTDRQSDMIISGGVNIYPLETEHCLLEHPAVGDVAVVGVPDAAMGETVAAVVRVREGHRADDRLAAALIAFARERIAHFKCPKTVTFVSILPRSETGKLQRRRVRDQLRAAPAS